MKPAVLPLSLLALLCCAPGCELADADDIEPDESDDHGKADGAGGGTTDSPIASLDDPDTVDVATWNIEFFGDTDSGPSDEPLQHDNAALALAGLDLDMYGLVEIVSADAFAELVARLPGYHGLLATDARVEGGADYYSSGEQKVALVLRDRFAIESARVILTENVWDFAGRPPLEVKLSFREDGKPRTLVVVVAHFKARANDYSYDKRVAAAAALHDYLDAEYPYKWVLVVGDFNDDIDESTVSGRDTPFAELVDDPDYRFTTDALSEAGISSTTHYPSTIDHHLATDDLVERFVEGSAQVVRLDRDLPEYDATTSDHYPVMARYDLR